MAIRAFNREFRHLPAAEARALCRGKRWTGTEALLRRDTLRLDGFVSVHSKGNGKLLTKPLLFEGNRLMLNFATSAIASVQVEIQEANGKPVPGFMQSGCPPLFGDAIERTGIWKAGPGPQRTST